MKARIHHSFIRKAAILSTLLLLAGCGACPPSGDPYYQPPAVFRKPSSAQVAGSYRDSWKFAQLTIMNTYTFNKDGTGSFIYDSYEHIDQTVNSRHESPLHWSLAPSGEIQTEISGRPGMASECAFPSRSTLRWTPGGLYNATNGRMYPTVGSPADTAKLGSANQSAIKYANNYKAVGEVGGAILTAGVMTAAAQNGGGGAAGVANAAGTAAAAGGGGIWTALGNGTWYYNDGTLKGTVNQQGYFFGTYADGTKTALRNPGTFTPGKGRMSQ